MPFAGRKTEMKKVKMSLETENILQETKVRHLSFMLPPEHKYHVQSKQVQKCISTT